jgi:hypothetical protein
MRGLAVLVGLAAAIAGAAGAGRTATGPVAVRVLALPGGPDIDAIWGATGHDREGRIWIGLSSRAAKPNSAVLVEYDPVAGTMRPRGDVVSNLSRSGHGADGVEQAKIHSRIVQMPDGYLYFASMDESGENPNGSKLPTWGGHLWRARGPEYTWEHLLQTPEALIAVSDGGRFVYALGYFNHVLYQFDTRTRAVRSVAVGSAGGHVSRNFFADERGHAYVPRVTRVEPSKPGDRPVLAAALVEFDPNLAEVAVSPLTDYYFDRGLDDSHGIVAIHPDGAGGWFFNTAKGRLYQVERVEGAASRVVDRGWFHADGRRYIASMFRDDKTGNLYGVSYSSSWGDRRFEWVTRSPGGAATAVPLPYADGEFPSGAVLYGSITRDRMGRFYVVGRMKRDPILLQVAVRQQ